MALFSALRSHDIPPYVIANYMEVITGYGFDVASVSIMFTACFVKYDTSKGHTQTQTHTHTHRHTHTQTYTHTHTHTHMTDAHRSHEHTRKIAAKIRSPNVPSYTSRTRSKAAFIGTNSDMSRLVTELTCCVLSVKCRFPQPSSTDCLRPSVRHDAF